MVKVLRGLSPLLEKIVTPLLLSNVSTLVSAVGLCLEPDEVNQRRVGGESRLIILYLMLFAICQTNKIKQSIVMLSIVAALIFNPADRNFVSTNLSF